MQFCVQPCSQRGEITPVLITITYMYTDNSPEMYMTSLLNYSKHQEYVLQNYLPFRFVCVE